jgi:hypothetical protein
MVIEMSKKEKYKWQFSARFRKGSFGWKSGPAIARLKEAVTEIKKISKKEPILAAEGAVLLIEKISPALEHVDSSSGAIGQAVNKSIEQLVDILSKAPADKKLRESWLERLFDAHEADKIPYIEILSAYWGELCGSKEMAAEWADRLLWITKQVFDNNGNFFHGTDACLSALYKAERFDELIDIVSEDQLWFYKRWVFKALVALGKKAEAIRYAEQSRNPWSSEDEINRLCEEVLLSSGLMDEAYNRYGLIANQRGTYLAWFRAVVKKYPHKEPVEILDDLVEHTPGDEGKWFAAAKEAGLYDEAISLANSSPCDPRTLTRAARDFALKNPRFALEAGLSALHWLALGYGYEITQNDVDNACQYTVLAATNIGDEDILKQIQELTTKKTIDNEPIERVFHHLRMNQKQ